MSRFAINVCLFLAVATVYVLASQCPDGCPCGQVCNNGTCQDGCMVFDNFVNVGETKAIYDRDCLCTDEVDQMGRVVKCAEATEFTGAPAGEPWSRNPNC